MPRFSQRFSASYVTGSHTFKAGLQLEESYLEIEAENGNHNVEYAFNRRCAGQPDAVGHAVRPQSAEQGLRVLRAGSVDAEASDGDLRRALRVLQRIRAGAARGGHAERLGARAQLRGGEERPVVEGRRSARRRRLRPLRQRQDRAEGGDRPVCGEDRHRDHAEQQPDPDVDQLGQPHVERPTIRKATRAAATSSRTATWRTAPPTASAARGRIRTSAGSAPPRATPTMRCSATARAATTGTSRPKCSTSSVRACR